MGAIRDPGRSFLRNTGFGVLQSNIDQPLAPDSPARGGLFLWPLRDENPKSARVGDRQASNLRRNIQQVFIPGDKNFGFGSQC